MIEKFIGLVFILAGIHRIYLKDQREYEVKYTPQIMSLRQKRNQIP